MDKRQPIISIQYFTNYEHLELDAYLFNHIQLFSLLEIDVSN